MTLEELAKENAILLWITSALVIQLERYEQGKVPEARIAMEARHTLHVVNQVLAVHGLLPMKSRRPQEAPRLVVSNERPRC